METLSRQAQKEQTRRGLVERAEHLFARQGISNTSTAEVAKALKVSHGTVFVHFPTRDELVLAVVEKFGERLSQELGHKLESHYSLKEMLEAHLLVLAEFEDFYRRLIGESPDLPPAVRSVLFSMNASLSYRFHRAAKEAMSDGKFKKLAQAPFFNTWLSLVHYHLLNRDLFTDKVPSLPALSSELVRHFLALIKN